MERRQMTRRGEGIHHPKATHKHTGFQQAKIMGKLAEEHALKSRVGRCQGITVPRDSHPYEGWCLGKGKLEKCLDAMINLLLLWLIYTGAVTNCPVQI